MKIAEIMWDIYNYFASDPIRLLTLIGGSGGVLYWWDRIRNRPRIYARILEVRSPIAYRQLLKFEIENRGLTPTSLTPKIMATGYDSNGMKRRFEFDLEAKEIYGQEAQDRVLPPSAPKTFSAIAWDKEEVYGYVFLRTFKFIPTKGKALKIRVRMLEREPLPFFRFGFDFMLYKFFGKTPWL
jgi:hypothetical protein